MSLENVRSVRKESVSIEWSRRNERVVGGGSGVRLIESLVKIGKWSDEEQWVKESEENQREESEEVMTKSRMWFLLWVLTWPRCKVVDNNNSDWCVYVLWSTCLGPGISLHEGLLLWLDFNYWFHSVRVLHWWSSASHWLLVLCPNGTTGSVVDGKFTSDLLRHQVK